MSATPDKVSIIARPMETPSADVSAGSLKQRAVSAIWLTARSATC